MTASRLWLALGAALGLLGVALGAFGAHWLQGALARWENDPLEQAKRLQTWEIGVRYQMYHALALLLLAILAGQARSALWNVAGGCFLAGTLVFSGLLYALTLSGVKVLGAIVPIGGMLLIVGWGALLAAALFASRDPSP